MGLLPQPNATDGRLLITGTLNAAFQNAFNLGEQFSIDLERLRPETQQLEVSAAVPYLLSLPVGVSGQLHVYRRDSTWVDANAEAGIQYFFEGGAYLKLIWENRSSSLQVVDTATVIRDRRLPPNPDLRQNAYGLETAFSRLDYRYNPRRGWLVKARTLAGYQKTLRNSIVIGLRDPADPGFDFATLYDSTLLRAARWRGELKLEYYLPLFQRSTLKSSLIANGIFSDLPVYNNEQYRLGGNKLLRGFNEQSLFATRFVQATLEYRLLIGPNSYLAAFTDYGYLENVTNRVRAFQRPWGFGTGLNFETQAGIFGISIAVGKPDLGLPVDFRAAKFHLGYVSLF
ncbi:MAG: BamA/TamA family outer membrane protein [Lewinellaceae bacterium]|nr:BamA/TamA family outer membrane protein [Lewinellaceae bacterium]